jgi:hypothetical protein
MNKTLISALNTVNNLLALAIIIAGTAAGFSAFRYSGAIVGACLGFLAGVIAASVVCGLLAILIEIEKHLRQLVAGQEVAPLDRLRQTTKL